MSNPQNTLSFDVERARSETRVCEDLVHFNNAGASLMPIPVSDALHRFLSLEETIGGYEAQAQETQALESVYSSTAKLINCKSTELAFTESATRAWQIAFYSFPLQRGDKIITTLAEYGSNMIAYLQQAERLGVEIVVTPNDESGKVDVAALQNLIDDRVKLISMTHIPTGGGLVNPAKAIGAVAKAANIPFMLDACQSVGQLHVDVEEYNCDMLCITGRKYLRGPRGTGLLYVRESLIDTLSPATLDQYGAELQSSSSYTMRPDARRFENWEYNCAAKVALGAAVDYCLSWGTEAIEQRVYFLAHKLRQKLSGIDGIKITDLGTEQCGIVTFTAEQASPQDIKEHLSANQINVSTSKGSGSLISFQDRGLTEVVRASVHYYNTESEIEYMAQCLKKLLQS